MAESSRQLGDATLERIHAEADATLTPPWQEARPGERLVIANTPEGYDACLLTAAPAVLQRPILHVCRDDARLSRLQGSLSFFTSGLEVRCLPAWDCLPYDRVSPNPELVARRLEALTALAQGNGEPFILLTTVSAILQKVPPKAAFKDAVIRLEPGGSVPQDDLLKFFGRNGYRRSGTVREPGEFAVRGGIIDVCPPGADTPMRLDCFGDELETIRRFDAMSQRTIGEESAVTLVPVSEILLDEDSIRRFRDGYRATFGVPVANDPLYEAVSSGQRHPGIEHWLPLFWERLESVFDYVPEALVTLDHQVDAAIDARLELIQDYYGARQEMQPTNERQAREEVSAVYQPVPPETLFLDLTAWRAALQERGVAEFTPFDGADSGGTRFDAGGKPPPDFASARARPDGNPFDAVAALVRGERDRPVLLAAHSLGSRERLATLLADHGVADLTPVETWAEVRPDPPGGAYLAVLDLDHGFSAPDRLVVSEQDILGERLVRPSRRRRQAEHFITEISSLSTGDLVVHIDHGIGRYEGLEAI
ncbi:MAG: transcription-repair coupling factor, partial [Alphaproteobacteria bacterium]|nr:transcription-repair coupling factor [Alphaproteobacteria bacterium]